MLKKILLFLFAALGSTPAQENVGLSERLHKIDPAIQDMIAKKKMAGELVMIAKDGQVAFTQTYGKMDLEADKPMRADAIFRIYSMTKAIATAAALTLVEEGKLGLDDPVGKWIAELKDLKVKTTEGLRDSSRPPTVKDLMLHIAGYTYGEHAKALESKDLDEMAAKLAKTSLAYDPGKDWQYSISIDVLGLVIERVSGTKLDRFLEERIFRPLDMKDTGFWVPAEKIERFAANYNHGADGLKRIDEPSKYAKPATFFSGGGGLVSTARDYMKFLLMIEGGGRLEGTRVLKEETVRLMTANQLPKEAFPIRFGKQVRHGTGFGLGFSVRTAETEWDPKARVGEYGWGGAASTHYWTSPKDRIVVVTLEQTMPYSPDVEFAIKGLIYDALAKP